uniref:ERAP1-like C-terminal domain-containing protein n=1 Tax=Picea sitchensis TaxID=3332 RepID=D5ACK7_PICSI|nr:unknown [Picea sitchensis]
MLRGQILELLAQFGHEETQEEAIRRFNAFLNDRSTPLLPADIRKAAYIAVMQNVTTSDKYGYESLLRIFRETDLSQEKVRILSSIALSPDSSIVREALDFSLSSEVRNQDAVFVLRGISREARETAWLWLKEKWEFIWKKWGSGILTARSITAVASPFSSEKKADEIQEFFSTRLQPSIERTVNQSIEQIRIRAHCVKHVQQQNGLVELLQFLCKPLPKPTRAS